MGGQPHPTPRGWAVADAHAPFIPLLPFRPAPGPEALAGTSGGRGPAASSEMSWVQAVPEILSPGDQDVFDEEADETLLVQREWQGHMRRRIQVNDQRPGCAGMGLPRGARGGRGTRAEAWTEGDGCGDPQGRPSLRISSLVTW